MISSSVSISGGRFWSSFHPFGNRQLYAYAAIVFALS